MSLVLLAAPELTQRRVTTAEAPAVAAEPSVNNRLSAMFAPVSLPLEQLAQTCGRLIAVQSALCNIENKGFPLVGEQFRPWQQIVALEENQTGSERGAFISIDEGVISGKIKKVSSGDFYRVGDERLPHHRRLRRCHR